MSLIAEQIHLRLGRREVLQGMSLTAKAGALTAIIGPNGSGKTTLLRVLTGEIAPSRGRVMLNGQDLAMVPAPDLARQRAVLPQHAALSFPFTASEIVRIGLTAHPGSAPEGDALIRAALTEVDLPDHAGRLYQELSGGEQQRIQLARALVQVWQPVTQEGPRWLLLDEPVSSLDIAHQLAVMRLAADYARRGGGVIAVMHDLNLTAMFASHVLLLRAGKVLAEGSPAEVMTEHHLSAAYGCRLVVGQVPERGPWFLPQMVGPPAR